MKLSFSPTAPLIALALATFGAPTFANAAGIRVAYLQAPGGRFDDYPSATLQDLLGGDSRFDLANSAWISSPVSSYELLANFDVVLASANSSPNFTGDQLADYVDGGGKLVTASFLGYYNNGSSWPAGRFNDPGYNPLTGSTTDIHNGVTLGSYDSSSPIMQGVNSLDSSTYNGDYTGVASGATLVASWSNGRPLVAVNANRNILDITLLPDIAYFGNASGDYRQLFANSLAYVTSPVPEPTAMAPFLIGTFAVLCKRRKLAKQLSA